jgi:hypothetical protein
MAIKEQLNTLLTKKMDRRDFLKHVGVGLVAVSGVSAIVKTLGSVSTTTTPAKSAGTTMRGYGSSTYGGRGQD